MKLKDYPSELAEVSRRLFLKQIPPHVATRLKFEIRARYENTMQEKKEIPRKVA